jgi:hypothetical protein
MKKTYTVQDVDAAVKHFETTKNSLRECVRLYGIPRMTLSDHVKGKHKSTIGAQLSLLLQRSY